MAHRLGLQIGLALDIGFVSVVSLLADAEQTEFSLVFLLYGCCADFCVVISATEMGGSRVSFVVYCLHSCLLLVSHDILLRVIIKTRSSSQQENATREELQGKNYNIQKLSIFKQSSRYILKVSRCTFFLQRTKDQPKAPVTNQMGDEFPQPRLNGLVA